MTTKFPSDHENPSDSQLIITLTGNAEQIKESLKAILNEISVYGKPCQGTSLGFRCTKSVITPVWNGKIY